MERPTVMQWGRTGNRILLQPVRSGRFKAETRRNHPPTGRKWRPPSVRGWLRPAYKCAVPEGVHVVHRKTGRMTSDEMLNEDSGDTEELHHGRLVALLHDLVRNHSGRRGAARVLGIDRRSVAACMDGRGMAIPIAHSIRNAQVLMGSGFGWN